MVNNDTTTDTSDRTPNAPLNALDQLTEDVTALQAIRDRGLIDLPAVFGNGVSRETPPETGIGVLQGERCAVVRGHILHTINAIDRRDIEQTYQCARRALEKIEMMQKFYDNKSKPDSGTYVSEAELTPLQVETWKP